MTQQYWQTRYQSSVNRASNATSSATREAYLALATHYRRMDDSLGCARYQYQHNDTAALTQGACSGA
jgi:hypothetical protein